MNGTNNNKITYREGAARRISETKTYIANAARRNLNIAYARFSQGYNYLSVLAGEVSEALSNARQSAGDILANITIPCCTTAKNDVLDSSLVAQANESDLVAGASIERPEVTSENETITSEEAINSYYGIKSALAATAIVAAAAYIITHPDETQAALENTQNFAQNIWDQAPSVESFQNYVADTWETAPSYESVTTFVQDSVESLQDYVADTWEITPSYNQISTFFKDSSQAVWNLVIPSFEINEECLAVNYGNHSNISLPNL